MEQMTKEKRDTLRAKSKAAFDISFAADAQYREQEVLPKMQRMIGDTFTYRNSYGGRSWTGFARIIGVKDSDFQFLCMERDCDGRISIYVMNRSERNDGSPPEEYTPVGVKTYTAGVEPILDELKKLAIRDLGLTREERTDGVSIRQFPAQGASK